LPSPPLATHVWLKNNKVCEENENDGRQKFQEKTKVKE
jgi:hypothetical protein